jgi:benzoyl-CoA reductase subunit C
MIPEFQRQFDRRHEIARRWKERGGKVIGYFYSYVPEELIYAAGMLPVQLMETGEDHLAAEGYLHDFVCDLVQSSFAQGLRGTYDYLDGMVVPFACDPLRYFHDLWKRNIGTPQSFLLNPLRQADEEARRYYREEWGKLREWLEDRAGVKITVEALRRAIAVCNEHRALLRQLYQLRRGEPPLLSGSEICEAVKAGLVMPREEHTELLRRLLAEVRERSPDPRPRIRLLLSGPIFEEFTSSGVNALRIIEEAGGEVVSDDFCTGLRYHWEPVPLKEDPLEALVQRYLGNIPCPFRYPPELRVERLLRQAEEHQVKGAIFLLPKYCDPYFFEQPLVERSFAERGIPVLTLEIASPIAVGALSTRLQAFLESLGA